MRVSKKVKKKFNVYNVAIFLCVIALIVLAVFFFMMLKPKDNNDDNKIVVGGVEIVEPEIKETDEITEEQAKQIAVKQFKNLDEDTTVDQLKVTQIRRGQVEYYYVTSAKNSMEIRILGGKVERVNSVLIEE